MERFSVKPGWILVFVLCAIPIIAWAQVLPLSFRFSNFSVTVTSLGQVCGLVGLTLFSVSIILSARLRIYESLFGGMNRVYISHHIIGGAAFIFLLAHPLLVSPTQLLPSSSWQTNLGIAALALLMTLLVVTYFINLPYQIWRLTHKFMGLALLFGGLHGIFMQSDVKVSPFLKTYFLILVSVALILFIYRTVLGRFLVKRYVYEVKAVEKVNPQAIRVDLKPMADNIKFLPGQFMFVSFNHPQFKETHPFSISSTPNDNSLSFTAKASGDWTNKLSELPIKTKAKIEGPFGYFTYSRYENKKQIWIAGGIGITPFYSMANALQSDYDIHLYYAVTDKSEAVYLNEITKLIKVTPWYSNSMGHITAGAVAKKHDPITAYDIFICGPLPMMNSLKKQFKDLGLKGSQLHTEEFRID